MAWNLVKHSEAVLYIYTYMVSKTTQHRFGDWRPSPKLMFVVYLRHSRNKLVSLFRIHFWLQVIQLTTILVLIPSPFLKLKL